MSNVCRLSLAIAVSAVLAGCSEAEPAANTAANTANVAVAAEAAAPVVNTAAPAAVSAGGAVTADYMVGKWSAMSEDCADTIEFRKDGTAATPFGEGKWSLVGDKLAMDFGEGSSKVDPSSVKPLGQDRIEITDASGGKETQKRC